MTVETAQTNAAPDRRTRNAVFGLKGTLGLTFCFLVLSVALVGPLLVKASPFDFVAPPFTPPTADLLLGSDALGRDVFVRLVHGGLQILLLAFFASGTGVLVGAILGVCAGYFRGVVDNVLMRLLDVILAFPQTILALLFVSILGPKWWIVLGIVALIHVPEVARVIRSAAMRIATEEFIQFADVVGTSRWRIVSQEILPNLLSLIVVEFGLRLTYSIAIITVLSFLGFGQQPPTPDWGLMINENRIGLTVNPWPVIAPVALIAILAIGVNLVADAMLQRMGSRGE